MSLLISFEGVDGVGKTTQIKNVARFLCSLGLQVLTTREPGGTKIGAALRELLLHSQEPVSPMTEALLFAADRAQHVEQVIRPALQRGVVVLTDRYVDSSLAYQIAGRALSEQAVRAINEYAIGALMPARTYVLDMPTAVNLERQRARGAGQDRIEAEGSAFTEQVRQEFLRLAGEQPERFLVVDASRTVEQIGETIQRDLVQVLLRAGLLEASRCEDSCEGSPDGVASSAVGANANDGAAGHAVSKPAPNSKSATHSKSVTSSGAGAGRAQAQQQGAHNAQGNQGVPLPSANLFHRPRRHRVRFTAASQLASAQPGPAHQVTRSARPDQPPSLHTATSAPAEA